MVDSAIRECTNEPKSNGWTWCASIRLPGWGGAVKSAGRMGLANARRVVLGLVACALWSTPAYAQQADEVEWQPHWTRFRGWQYGAGGAILAGTIATSFAVDFRDDGGAWENEVDSWVRDRLVARSREGRDRARTVGDIGFRGMLVYPYLVDTLLVTWVGHGAGDVAGQMFLINTQSFALTAMLVIPPEKFIARARPSTEPCERDDEYERFCDGSDEFGSFPSGHAAIAAAGAGLTCVHHQHLPLYGGGIADAAACVAASGLALTTGVARIVNDRHWLSDVLLGSAAGAVSGYLVPLWLHYGAGSPAGAFRTGPVHWALLPLASGQRLGLAMTGYM